MASPADILALLRTVRERAETVMIVGHNPGLEDLVVQLTGERQDLPTAALAQVVLPIGHVSVQTRERYLGCKQKLRIAVNDRLGVSSPDAA